jgi:GT2 family glycosyltransferase
MSHREPFWGSEGWQAAAVAERPFVRYRSPEASPGCIVRHAAAAGPIRLSVVIPTLDGCRDGYFSRLLVQIERQDFREYEVLVVRGDPRQGRAINTAAALARGRYLLTLDDDTSLPDPLTFSKLVTVMEAHPGIGIAGSNNLIPKDATPFVRRVMKELPRRSWSMVEEITDSDLAEHPCMIMRAAEFKQLGGENEWLPRGLDPYLRMEYRKLGKRVVVVPDVVYHHLPPASLGRLLRQFYRNGRHAAYVNRHHPNWVLETPVHHGPFRQRVPFAIRALRFPLQLLAAISQAKPLWLLSEMAYGFGFMGGYLRMK